MNSLKWVTSASRASEVACASSLRREEGRKRYNMHRGRDSVRMQEAIAIGVSLEQPRL
jgi:hypothetical protein